MKSSVHVLLQVISVPSRHFHRQLFQRNASGLRLPVLGLVCSRMPLRACMCCAEKERALEWLVAARVQLYAMSNATPSPLKRTQLCYTREAEREKSIEMYNLE